MALTLWHNPRCSKSRAALALLTERGVAPEIRLYLRVPPSVVEVRALADRLLGDPARLLRTAEARKAGLLPATLDAATVAALIAAHPSLLERPILDTGRQAVIGRPPEDVLAVL